HPRQISASVATHPDVFVNREIFEDPAAFHHLEDPGANHLLRLAPIDSLPHESYIAVGNLPVFALEQAGDRFQRGALSGPVRAQPGADLPLLDVKRQSLQPQDDVVVDNLDVVDAEPPLPGLKGPATLAFAACRIRRPSPTCRFESCK